LQVLLEAATEFVVVDGCETLIDGATGLSLPRLRMIAAATIAAARSIAAEMIASGSQRRGRGALTGAHGGGAE
jgi:hypothetical protein